jgi:SAM-dependent methyltransferase
VRSLEAHYWDEIAGVWTQTRPQALWRAHSDLVNSSLFSRWLPSGPTGRLLKTDLFDEAFGVGLYPLLKSRSCKLTGMDVSILTLSTALSRYCDLKATCTDIRRLPFADAAFDIVVSNSTLDHFESMDEIVTGLRELRRVLKPGGQLLLTLDNLANPLIALRNILPFPLLNRLGIVPYYVGISWGPRRLLRILRQLELEVVDVDTLMHAPRVIAVAVARLLERHAAPKTQQKFLRFLMSFEQLSRWPTRFLTGHFVAVRAING